MSDDRTETAPSSRGKRYLPIVLGIGALLSAGVMLAVLLAPANDEPTVAKATYTDEVEDVFIAACTADGGAPVEPVCQCFYDGIVAEIPYDRYQHVNELLLASPPASGEPLPLPDDLDAILTDCRRNDG